MQSKQNYNSDTNEEDIQLSAAYNTYFTCAWVGDIHYKGLGIFAKENIKLEKIEGLIEFKNVDFSYVANKPIIKNCRE